MDALLYTNSKVQQISYLPQIADVKLSCSYKYPE